MRHEIHTKINIKASAKQVWSEFINFKNYHEWNPFIHKVKGDLLVGSKLKVKIGTMKFKPTVQSNMKYKEFSWRGRFLLPGVFDGRHVFQLTEQPDGTTDFIHEEYFFGVLVPLSRKKLKSEIAEGFNAMNKALKELVESKS